MKATLLPLVMRSVGKKQRREKNATRRSHWKRWSAALLLIASAACSPFGFGGDSTYCGPSSGANIYVPTDSAAAIASFDVKGACRVGCVSEGTNGCEDYKVTAAQPLTCDVVLHVVPGGDLDVHFVFTQSSPSATCSSGIVADDYDVPSGLMPVPVVDASSDTQLSTSDASLDASLDGGPDGPGDAEGG